MKPDICERDNGVIYELRGGYKIYKPLRQLEICSSNRCKQTIVEPRLHCWRVGGTLDIGQLYKGRTYKGERTEHRNRKRHTNTINRHTTRRAFRQELGRLAFQSKSQQSTACTVDVAVTGGIYSREDKGVHNMWKNLDFQTFHCYHIRR